MNLIDIRINSPLLSIFIHNDHPSLKKTYTYTTRLRHGESKVKLVHINDGLYLPGGRAMRKAVYVHV